MSEMHRSRFHTSPTYHSWKAMKTRCLNCDHPSSVGYGRRGITVEPFLLKFRNFLEYMGERPAGMTLDRLDSDGPYCRGNIRWATQKQQSAFGRNMTTRAKEFAWPWA